MIHKTIVDNRERAELSPGPAGFSLKAEPHSRARAGHTDNKHQVPIGATVCKDHECKKYDSLYGLYPGRECPHLSLNPRLHLQEQEQSSDRGGAADKRDVLQPQRQGTS